MTDVSFHHFPITLDPSAQEFWPTHNNPNPIIYYFPAPPPPPPLPNPPPPLPPPSTVPTRSLLLSLVPTTVSESTVRRDLELFGDVRAVQMERLRDGILTVHFYDLRQAVKALNEIKEQHMQQQCRLRKHFDELMILSPVKNFISPLPLPSPSPARGLLDGRAIWAQYTFPVAGGFPDGYNQGTIVVFNLGSDVSNGVIRQIFEPFGCVKEIRDNNKNKKFVEFYDTRDAAKAVIAVNGQEIKGKPVVVEFSRPGGQKNSYKQYKFLPISPGGVQAPPVAPPYRPPPMPFSNDRMVDYGCVREVNNVNSPWGGVKKNNGKNFIKHQVSPEQNARCVSGGDRNNKRWKGSRYTREKCDVRFLMKEDDLISSFRDSRTTVMIKNIPNKYSQKLLLNMLDNHCIQCNEQVEAAGDDNLPLSSYDFVYLPIDFVNKCNVGYGFVNMTTPEATWRLHKAFHHQNWEVFNSKKICEISYARLQGLEALKDHFKNSKFPREAEEYMPVVFTPPRDGRVVSDPTPITGRSGSSNGNSITTLTSSSSSSLTSEVVGEEEEGGNELDLIVDNNRSSCNNNNDDDKDNLLVVEDTKSDITTCS